MLLRIKRVYTVHLKVLIILRIKGQKGIETLYPRPRRAISPNAPLAQRAKGEIRIHTRRTPRKAL
jgi:energy-converting hydrogenase Eha subunit F